MADGNENPWWSKTRFLALAVLSGGGVAIVATMLIAHDDTPARDALLAPLIPTLIAPLLVVGLIFWAAGRQRRIDNAHGIHED